jgi:transcriptional regulator with XRE-family HTH domain
VRTSTSDITAKRVGAEIRATRLAQGMSQAELAERLGADASYISKVEAGHENLTLGQLAKLARGLGAGLMVLFPTSLEEREALELEHAGARAAALVPAV